MTWLVRRYPRGVSALEDSFPYFEKEMQCHGSMWVARQRDATRFRSRSAALDVLHQLRLNGPGIFRITRLVKRHADANVTDAGDAGEP